MTTARRKPPEPVLSAEVAAQVEKLEALNDRHALTLLWLAIRHNAGAQSTRLVALLALVVALLVPQTGAAARAPAVSISLEPVAGGQVRGGATLAADRGGTRVQLAVAGLPRGASAAVRLHAGACSDLDRLSASSALLARLTAGPGRAHAATRVRFRGSEEVPLSALTDGEHVIVVAVGGRVVACGTIPDADPPLVVVGKAIGPVALGMARSDVVRAYGEPRSESAFTFPNGTPGRTDRYRRHGASFVVIYGAGRVVWIETSSRYYRTAGGVGVGSRVGAASTLPGFRPDLCDGGYSRRAGGTLTSFIPDGRAIGRVRIVRLAFFDC